MAASGCAAYTGAQRRAPSAERVVRGGDQARRRRRARSAHATGAEREAAPAGMQAQLASAVGVATRGGFCLLAQL